MLLAARIVEAAWDAASELQTDVDWTYPEAVVARVFDVVKNSTSKGAIFDVMVGAPRQLTLVLLVQWLYCNWSREAKGSVPVYTSRLLIFLGLCRFINFLLGNLKSRLRTSVSALT